MAQVLGQIIAGSFEKILVRQKSGKTLELGDLVSVRGPDTFTLCQVYDLFYGSQLSQQNLELMSGMRLESNSSLELFDTSLRTYTLAALKALITLKGGQASLTKSLPPFFSNVNSLESSDMEFLKKPQSALQLGMLRSGSKCLPIDIFIDGEMALSHHMLIAAQTGKGKSNLTKCLLWYNLNNPHAGILVLDPHDEYYGRTSPGLKDHPNKTSVSYFTTRMPPPGSRTFRINVRMLRPSHFMGVASWTEAQTEGLYAAHRLFGAEWIERIITADSLEHFHEGTLGVLKRRLMWLLDCKENETKLTFGGAFTATGGEGTISAIISDLENRKTVIIDTSSFSGGTEALISTLLGTELLGRYQHANSIGELHTKPVISIVLEEAARVLGRESIERGPNIFSTLAREGRKFKVGLLAITQIPSMIPREVLANIGTKIILGLEMSQERSAVIEAAAQDLSTDDRTIASLDKGEALVTSTFTKFAIPIAVPLFNEMAGKTKRKMSLSVPELS